MEQQIKIAEKLYKCRSTARKLFGVDYSEKLRPYINAIKVHQKKFNLEVLPSVLEICSFESVRDNEMAIILFMAASVEMIENK